MKTVIFCAILMYFVQDYQCTIQYIQCKENEEFSECGNHGCLDTCSEPEKLSYCIVVPGCFPGCKCKEGFLRNEDGICVPEKLCHCPKNQKHSKCRNNACQDTCEKPNMSSVCKGPCISGCVCKDGFVRHPDGDCGPLETCENRQCRRKSEEYQECGTACPKSCENKNNLIICTKECVTGCFCKKGYVRDESKNCILPENCPKPTETHLKNILGIEKKMFNDEIKIWMKKIKE